MSFTIYTVSDPATVGSVLTSMAMFFGQDSWVGSALKLALIISLIVILAKGVTRDGLRLDIMLLQLLVIMGAFIPKTTVTVEQFDNAAPPRVVDGVPYAIAIPGTIAGAFAMYMTQKIETVMTNVEPNYIPVSGDLSPFTPARTLMWYASCATDPMRCVDSNLRETMQAAAEFCGTGGLENTQFDQKSDIFTAFANGLNANGMTMIYDANYPFSSSGGGGQAVTCSDAAAYLKQISTDLTNGDPRMFQATMDGVAESSDIKRYGTGTSPASSSDKVNEALGKINRITNSNAQINVQAMANVITYSSAQQIAREGSSGLDQSIIIKRDIGLFDWAKTESEKSLLVTTTAPKFMDILFFIFIAATPIVMFVVAANPSTGLKVAASYVLFGVWTQSWIPMMAIITGWYQAELHNYPGPQADLGMTPEYMAGFMRYVDVTTIAASNMMQTAPYMMFAIMTGSMFALSSMIAKAAPSGGENAAGGGSAAGGSSGSKAGSMLGVPGPGGSDASAATAQRQSYMAGMHALGGGSGGFGSEAAFTGGSASANLPGLPQLSTGAAVNAISAANSETAASSTASLQKQQAQAVAELSSLIKRAGHSVDGGKVAKQMSSAGYATTYDSATGELKVGDITVNMKNGQINSTSAGTKTEAGVKGEIGVGFKSSSSALGFIAELISGAKVNGSLKAGGSFGVNRTGSSTVATGLEESKSTGVKHSKSKGDGVSEHHGEEGGTGLSGSDTTNKAEIAETGKRLSDTFSRIASQAKQISDAKKTSEQAQNSASTQTTSSINGGQIVDGWSAMQGAKPGGQSGSIGIAMQRIQAALGGVYQGAQLEAVVAKAAARETEMRTSGVANTLNADQRAAAATLYALADTANGGASPQEKAAAFGGMLALARGAGIAGSDAALSTIQKSADQFRKVADDIKKVSDAVKPITDAAGAKTDTKVEGMPAVKKAIDKQLTNYGKAAVAAYGAAETAAGGVQAKGKELVDKDRNTPPVGIQTEQGLKDQAKKNSDSQPFFPINADQQTLGSPHPFMGGVDRAGLKAVDGLIGLPNGPVGQGEATAGSIMSPPLNLGGGDSTGQGATAGLSGLLDGPTVQGKATAGSVMNSVPSMSGLLHSTAPNGAPVSAKDTPSTGGAASVHTPAASPSTVTPSASTPTGQSPTPSSSSGATAGSGATVHTQTSTGGFAGNNSFPGAAAGNSAGTGSAGAASLPSIGIGNTSTTGVTVGGGYVPSTTPGAIAKPNTKAQRGDSKTSTKPTPPR